MTGCSMSAGRPNGQKWELTMNHESDVTELMLRVRQGDDEAAQALWDRYFHKLVRRATDQLGRHQRMSDGEDAALWATHWQYFYKLNAQTGEEMSNFHCPGG